MALRVPHPENSLRIEHQLKRQDARKEINARLDELEQRNEAFKEIINVSETKAVEIWVQVRTLKGPRNI
jgi:glyceraldehyde-3-phosphate dehydrogenase/erythrose-4-phosphate dehydrogenase